MGECFAVGDPEVVLFTDLELEWLQILRLADGRKGAVSAKRCTCL